MGSELSGFDSTEVAFVAGVLLVAGSYRAEIQCDADRSLAMNDGMASVNGRVWCMALLQGAFRQMTKTGSAHTSAVPVEIAAIAYLKLRTIHPKSLRMIHV